MEWWLALVLELAIIMALMGIGLPVVFAFFGANIVGAMLFLGGEAGLVQMTRNAMVALTTFSLAPIPLFILMGEILFHTGVAFKAINAIDILIRRVPGRLSIVSVVGGTVFSSLSGSTIANTAMLGSVLLPDMMRRGYHPSIAMGPIMATGGIAMLIPPSALAVLLGSLAEISISRLLVAGIIPGLIMAAVFIGYVLIRCTLNPAIAPAEEQTEDLTLWQRWRPFLIYVVPLFMIFILVVGSIVGGFATPTESAAIGSVAAALATVAYRALTFQNLIKSLTETAKVTVMILIIISGSITFSQILAFSGATRGLLALITGLFSTQFAVLLSMLIILLILGAFMDQVSMMMITLPFYIPLVAQLGIDKIWFGILMLLVLEISFTTPPFGLLLYVMKGVAPPNITIGQIYRAAGPFVCLALAVLVLIFAFPKIATWLPSLMVR